MEFDILGPLRATSADGALELGAPAQRALLGVLLTSPNVPVSDDRLVDELWDDEPPPSAHHLVHVYISRLRALLSDPPGGPRIKRDGGGYVLRLLPDELDAERFLAAVAQGRELRDRDPEAADEILADAMRLWQGVPFADLAEPPPECASTLGIWSASSWRRSRPGSTSACSSADITSSSPSSLSWSSSTRTTRRFMLSSFSPCTAVAARPRHSRPPARFRCGCAKSLGSMPPPRSAISYDLLLQAPRLSLEPPEPPSNLPRRLTSFVGRRRELQEVTELLQASRLLTLTGGRDRKDSSGARGGPAGAGPVPGWGLVDRSGLGDRSCLRPRRGCAHPRGERDDRDGARRRRRAGAQPPQNAAPAGQLRARGGYGRGGGGTDPECHHRSPDPGDQPYAARDRARAAMGRRR